MTTIVAWVLVLYISGSSAESGGPTVVDNIDSEKNCHSLAVEIAGDFPQYVISHCYAVRKVVARG